MMLVVWLSIALAGCSSSSTNTTTEVSEASNGEVKPGSTMTPLEPDESQTSTIEAQNSIPTPNPVFTVSSGGEVASVDITPTEPELTLESTQNSLPIPTENSAPPSPTATPAPLLIPVDSITLELVAEGFQQPTYLTHAGDERLLVSEQVGRIRTIVDGQVLQEPFLDITQRVGSTALEQGLFSFAYHPQYSTNGYFYVNYTDRAGDTVVARYEVSQDNPNRADEGSESVLLKINQPYDNHNGGQLQFGPDGYLYISIGDGGSAGDPGNNGQNPATLLGSLLRIDVDGSAPYSIPLNNPFTANNLARDEIWATGLRNPWRFSFDRLTGDMYIADVGQNQWEEINFQSALDTGGSNYGWRILEGTHCYDTDPCSESGYVMPVTEYSHAEGGCSVTGGYVYRGAAYPELGGNYFFGDYCSGIIWSLFQLADGGWERTAVAQLRANITSFGEDASGEVYVLDHYNGAIYQIHP